MPTTIDFSFIEKLIFNTLHVTSKLYKLYWFIFHKVIEFPNLKIIKFNWY